LPSHIPAPALTGVSRRAASGPELEAESTAHRRADWAASPRRAAFGVTLNKVKSVVHLKPPSHHGGGCFAPSWGDQPSSTHRLLCEDSVSAALCGPLRWVLPSLRVARRWWSVTGPVRFRGRESLLLLVSFCLYTIPKPSTQHQYSLNHPPSGGPAFELKTGAPVHLMTVTTSPRTVTHSTFCISTTLASILTQPLHSAHCPEG
jgi:hypothetical protein